ncbi:MAG: YbjQ family protein [Dehalococcoidia bacterium]
MLTVTTPTIEGSSTVQVLGLVQGNTVRARHVGRDLIAALRNIVGGEIGQYSRLLSDAREEALQRLIQQAEGLGANAVVNLRFSTSMITNGAAEILAYGTAVLVEPGTGCGPAS